MSYVAKYDNATERGTVLHKQVAVALRKAALDVSNDPEQPAKRQAWAKRILANPANIDAEAAAVLWRVLDNPTIAAAPQTSPDNDIQYVINTLIGEFAGESSGHELHGHLQHRVEP